MKRILHIWFFLILGIVTCLLNMSCRSVQWVQVDRLTPAKMNVTNQVHRVAVVSNRYPSEHVSKKLHEVMYFDVNVIADSLAQYLADAAYFDEVIRVDSVLSSDMLKDSVGRELKPEIVEKLCRELSVDMLLVVDRLSFLPQHMDYPYVMGEASVHVKCYKAVSLWPTVPIDEKATFGWSHWDDLKRDAISWAAKVVLPFIVPQWNFEELPYYTGANAGQREAAIFVREGNWDGAALIWKQQLQHKNLQRRMEAYFNMAVYHEVKDDVVDSARVYAEKALELSAKGQKNIQEETLDYKFISEYIEEMGRRGTDLKRVKAQMARFSDDF